MGVVYRAEQLRYGRRVALKVLAPELSADGGFRERFQQEWQTAAKLEHPNIVPVYEAGEAGGVLYIAMRYVEGIDLNALLAREGRLEPRRALAIVAQVGVALDAAHAQGLVHRDVKPGNILLAGGGGLEGDHVYLTDFGVAKQTATRSGLTKTGLFIGTVDYAAPEQIEGKPLDGRADVYALGCVLYQCLTGALPYEKDSDVAMLYAHLMDPPPSPQAKRPDLPSRVRRDVRAALAKSPADRYSTCRELVAAAREAAGLAPAAPATGRSARTVVESRPSQFEPLGTAGARDVQRWNPWWRTRTAIVGAVAVAIAAGGAGIGIALGGGGGGGETLAATIGTGGEPITATSDAGTAATETSSTTDAATTDEAPATTEAPADTGAYPNELESALLTSVPAATRPDCDREPDDVRAADAVAGVVCTSGRVTVYYDSFATNQAMNTYYQSYVESSGATQSGEACDSDAAVDGTWNVEGTRKGKLLCYTNDGNAVMIWTHDDLHILSYAARPGGNRAALYKWWLGPKSGPVEQ